MKKKTLKVNVFVDPPPPRCKIVELSLKKFQICLLGLRLKAEVEVATSTSGYGRTTENRSVFVKLFLSNTMSTCHCQPMIVSIIASLFVFSVSVELSFFLPRYLALSLCLSVLLTRTD